MVVGGQEIRCHIQACWFHVFNINPVFAFIGFPGVGVLCCGADPDTRPQERRPGGRGCPHQVVTDTPKQLRWLRQIGLKPPKMFRAVCVRFFSHSIEVAPELFL